MSLSGRESSREREPRDRLGVRVYAAAVLVTSTIGCFPAPQQKVSNVSGTVSERGVPVSGVEVVWERPDSITVVTRTDSLGHFQFEGRRGWGIIVLLPAHCITEWSLRVDQGGLTRGVGLRDYGPCEAPEEIHLDCDFSRDTDFCEMIQPKYLESRLRELPSAARSSVDWIQMKGWQEMMGPVEKP